MNHFDWMRESDTYPHIGATRYPNGEAIDPVSLADTKADLHVEESGWLPSSPTREQAWQVIWGLLGFMSGATVVSAVLASAAAATTIALVLVPVWIVTFLVWWLWG